MTNPLVSLALPIKNCLPSLRRALEALQRQTYQNFELVVQDGGSTDDSVEVVQSFGLPRVDVVSERDTGHGQAFNRAWSRCQGPLVCMLASDEFLEDQALETFVRWHAEHPSAAYCYGSTRLWANESEVHSVFRPGKFDFLRLLMSELSPGQAGVYNREVIGRDFYFDENLRTCPDFDLFLRLGLRFGPLEIVEKDGIVHNSIRGRSLTTYHPASYDQIAQDKLFVLDRFFVSQGNSRFNRYLHRVCTSATYCWMASMIFEVAGDTPQFHKYVIEAAKHDPGGARIAALVARSRGLIVHPDTGQVLTRRQVQPELPPHSTVTLDGIIDLAATRTDEMWSGAETIRRDSTMCVTTGSAPWTYAAQVALKLVDDFTHGGWYWLDLALEIQSGQIGVAIVTADGHLRAERLLQGRPGRIVRVTLPLSRTDTALLIRNGSLEERSVANLLEARVLGMPIPDPASTAEGS